MSVMSESNGRNCMRDIWECFKKKRKTEGLQTKASVKGA